MAQDEHSCGTDQDVAPEAAVRPSRRVLDRSRVRMLVVVFIIDILLFAMSWVGPKSGALAAAAVACAVVVAVWRPQWALGAGLLAFPVFALIQPNSRVRHWVAIVVVVFAAALASILLRRILRQRGWHRSRTPLDLPIVLIGAYGMFSTVYGLLQGHAPEQVAISAWGILSLPLFYLVVTLAVNTPDRLAPNVALVAFWSLLGLPLQILMPGEGGGNLSHLAPPFLAMLLTTPLPVAPWALALPLGLCLLDVLQSAFRSLWLSTFIASLWVTLTGMRRGLRRGPLMIGVIVVGISVMGGLVLPQLLRHSALGSDLREATQRSSGYRMEEIRHGWQAFAESPLIGKGFGYVNPRAYLIDLEAYGAGPIYHMHHMTILTGQGVIGLLLAIWLQAIPLFGPVGRWQRRNCRTNVWAAVGVGLQGSIVGSFLSAAFAGPAISHYEWAVYPTLCLLSAVWGGYRAMPNASPAERS